MTDTSNTDDGNFIIDSTGWIEYFCQGEKADEFGDYIEKASPETFFTPAIVIYEVYKKIYRDISEEEALKSVAHIKYLTKIIDLTDELAISSAEISTNEQLPMADAIIYAIAKRYNAKLVTSDAHFREKSGVIYLGD